MSAFAGFEKKKGDYPEWFKFPNVGDEFSGIFHGAREQLFRGSDEETMVLDVTHDDGTDYSIICGSVGLHNRMIELDPPPGSHIHIRRGADAGNAHTWVVTISDAAPPAAPTPPTPQADSSSLV